MTKIVDGKITDPFFSYVNPEVDFDSFKANYQNNVSR